MPLRHIAVITSVILAVAAASCSETVLAPRVLTLDRPSAVSFGCYGNMIDSAGEQVVSAMPVHACSTWATGVPPEGQDALPVDSRPTTFGFILQKAQGSVVLTGFEVLAASWLLADADPLTPRINPVPVGILPVDIATSPQGCHFATANSGTCDLSVVPVESVVSNAQRPIVLRQSIIDAAGDSIDARPHAMVGDDAALAVGEVCTREPDSWLVYVAYPDCNAVAAIDVATGQAVAAVQFDEAGVPTITDGTLNCTSAGGCGTIVPADDSVAPRPTVLELAVERDPDTGVETLRRLYIGAENSPDLTIVDLDDGHLPASTMTLPLEGDVGVMAMAASEQITFSGGNQFRFVYAATTDGTIRVADVGNGITECETQGDTRYLHSVTDLSFLPCMPVLDPRTPPRRLDAVSPGIQVIGDAVPMDIAFVEIDNSTDDVLPTNFDGHFAYIPLSTGQMMVVNVFDRSYAENIGPFETQPGSAGYVPFAEEISLALPHRIRDTGTLRTKLWDPSPDADGSCQSPDNTVASSAAFGPRLSSVVDASLATGVFDESKRHLLPSMREVTCEPAEGQLALVSELSITADPDTRRLAFPDWTSVPGDEQWLVRWEGGLHDARFGLASFAGGFALRDSAAPFCRLGVEQFDTVRLVGCDPNLGGADCGLGETCFVHPDTPAGLPTGLCFPVDRAGELSGACRNTLTTLRSYSVRKVDAGRLELAESRRSLRSTPLDGCIDNAHCDALWERETALILDKHPSQVVPGDFDAFLRPTFSCEPDPGSASTAPRCMMTCQENADCGSGFSCSQGYCVRGQIPPAECVASPQRYQVQGKDAFVVVGSRSGYRHNRIIDPATGACVDDPDAHPLSVGRIPLQVPACTGDGSITDVGGPNPCMTTFDTYVDRAVVYNGADCTDGQQVLVERTSVNAIRFMNDQFRMHLVDPVTRGDGVCDGDRAGTGDEVPAVFTGYTLSFNVIGGLGEMRLNMVASGGGITLRLAYPRAIIPGPLGNMWVMDEGDRGSVINGQVLVFPRAAPLALSANNYLQ